MNVFKVTTSLLKAACFFGTIYMTIHFIQEYHANEDSSHIIIKRFRQSEIFPAISLCFRSKHNEQDGLYNHTFIKDMLSIQSNDYKNALLGKPSTTSIGNIIDAEFDEATIKLQTYLKKFRVQDTNENEFTWSFDENISDIREVQPEIIRHQQSDLPETVPKLKSMTLKYQDPNFICYEYMSDLISEVTIDSIDFYFYISKLQEINKGELYIFVYQPNQLIRNLRYLYKIRGFYGISQATRTNQIVLDLNAINLIHARDDANEPCDENLEDDDSEWAKQVIDIVRCVPPYWRTTYQGRKHPQCTTTEQLKNISFYLPMKNEFGATVILEKYRQPCRQMRVQANANSDQYKKEDVLKLKLRLRFVFSLYSAYSLIQFAYNCHYFY